MNLYKDPVEYKEHQEKKEIKHPLNGFGFLVPEVENLKILGTLFSSTLFPGRAPDGQVLLTTFVGGERNPELASAYNGLAYIYERLNRYDEALQHINKALTLATKKDSGHQVYISRKNSLTAQVSATNKAQLK